MNSFETKVTGKWILSGEHSVLRGSPALVFPLPSRVLHFQFLHTPRAEKLDLQLGGEHGGDLQLLVWGVIEKACDILKISRSELKGHIIINSNIPIGAGLGASAALCVAISRWLVAQKLLSENELPEFSRQLENLFHGESSGVDIAVALSGKPIKFYRNGTRKEISLNWQPKLYISYSGKKGLTSECVSKVKAYMKENPQMGEIIDRDMSIATEKCELALGLHFSEGFLLLREGIELAHRCFKVWGLASEDHTTWLYQHGALAVKPTGSGGGGYVLSLWNTEPSPEVLAKLIPCF